MSCPLGAKNPVCKACPFAKDDGTVKDPCDFPYIGAEKMEITSAR